MSKRMRDRYQYRRDGRWWLAALRVFSIRSIRLDVHVVTGADSSHFLSMLNLIESVRVHEPRSSISVWDLGLTSEERSQLEVTFPSVRVTEFPYADYPTYFDIKTDAGQYAWKPVIIDREVSQARGRLVFWLDAGDLVRGRLLWLRQFTKRNGFYSPYSDNVVRHWTHPGTIDRLGVDAPLLNFPNLNGAIVCVDPDNVDARQLIADWAARAQDRDCIAPHGSSRANHRQDQAVLTVLAYQHGLAQPWNDLCKLTRGIRVLLWQDIEQRAD